MTGWMARTNGTGPTGSPCWTPLSSRGWCLDATKKVRRCSIAQVHPRRRLGNSKQDCDHINAVEGIGDVPRDDNSVGLIMVPLARRTQDSAMRGPDLGGLQRFLRLGPNRLDHAHTQRLQSKYVTVRVGFDLGAANLVHLRQ